MTEGIMADQSPHWWHRCTSVIMPVISGRDDGERPAAGRPAFWQQPTLAGTTGAGEIHLQFGADRYDTFTAVRPRRDRLW